MTFVRNGITPFTLAAIAYEGSYFFTIP
jgi:hypothetical protein